jgi:hypothetical protein
MAEATHTSAQVSASAAQRVRTLFSYLNTLIRVIEAVEDAKAQNVARTCGMGSAVMGPGVQAPDCRGSGVNIYFPSMTDQPDTAFHNFVAIGAGYPAHLHYLPGWEGISETATHERKLTMSGRTECNDAARDQFAAETGRRGDCDEYPFASAAEGGPGSSLMLVAQRHNRKQGGTLSRFYNFCGLSNGDPTNINYVVVPQGAGDTTHICRNGAFRD